MTKHVLTDARVYIGPYDFSGRHNRISLDLARAPLAAETFVDDTEIKDTGLASVRLSGSGFWEAGAEAGAVAKKIDDALFANFTVQDVPVTVVPSIGLGVGGPAYSIQAATASYRPITGQHGQLIGFQYEVVASAARVIRGRILHTGTIDADGNGAGVELGVLAAGERLHAVVHAYAFAGPAPTLDLAIQSDIDNAFATAVQRASFAQISGFEAEWIELDGPVADDDWWRITKDVSVDGSFSAIVLASRAAIPQ